MDTRLYTAEELFEMGDDFELDEGRLVPMSPGSPVHGIVCLHIGAELLRYARQRRLGAVMCNDTGFHIQSAPDTVRGPDVAFVARDRLAGRPDHGFWKTSPDLAVEVVSPRDRGPDVHRKVKQYLAAGCPLVWVVHTRKRQVTVYRPDGSTATLSRGQTLDGEAVLPGFSWPVADIFDVLDE